MSRWKNRIAMITGASSGIGWETAKTLAGEGMRIAACARRTDHLDQLIKEINTGPSNLLPISIDLRLQEEVKTTFKEIRTRWGGVDVLINNAGVGYKSPIYDGNLSV
jgi:NADP-dependent 3-hydroxy acid dehydrogenase YdfG